MFFRELRERIRELGLTQSELARGAGIQQGSLSRFLAGSQPTLSGESLARLLEYLGAEVVFSGGRPCGREVCFVNARKVGAQSDAPGPQAEDYIAAPLVGEVGAGPGFVPEERIKSWFLAYKNLPAIMYRKNLIAVEIGPKSTSMLPTLAPGDIVLVDRDDRDVSRPGHMMLVLDPTDGSGMVKRVSVSREDDGDWLITYYSDNAAQYPPSVYSLRRHFEDDWERSIVGRVIWAWSDVRGK